MRTTPSFESIRGASHRLLARSSFALLLGLGAGFAEAAKGRIERAPSRHGQAAALASSSTLRPCSFFEPSAGRTAGSPLFTGRAGGKVLLVGPDGAEIRVPCPGPSRPGTPEAAGPAPSSRASARFRFVEALAGSLRPRSPLPSRSHHFIGNDPRKWRTDVPNFASLVRPGLYPGIDLEWLAREGAFEYRLTVAPGADPGAVRLYFPGCGRPRLGAGGDLQVEAAGGRMTHSRPVAFQRVGGESRGIEVAFQLLDGGQAGFRVGAYDRALPLVIDPFVDFSTYFGSTNKDEDSTLMTVDSSGDPYLGGRVAFDGSVVTTNGAFQVNRGGSDDLFVTKFSAATRAPIYTTYLGGEGIELMNGLAVDSTGAVVMSGATNSHMFPIQSAIYPTKITVTTNIDIFCAKLAPDGGSLVFSTYYGSSDSPSSARSLALDGNDDIYLGCQTQGSNFPTVNAMIPSKPGSNLDGALVKLKGDGSEALFSTYLPSGAASDFPAAIAVHSDGAMHVAGYTESTNLPVRNAAQSALSGLEEIWVLRIFADASDYDYLTYLGGSAREDLTALAVDSNGRTHLYGYTRSSNFPMVSAYDSSRGGVSDAFLTVLASDGKSFEYSTYLGGSGDETTGTFTLMPDGTRFLVGTTTSTDFPTVTPVQATYGGGTSDAFLARLAADGASLEYSTYLGGGGEDKGRGIALVSPKLWVAGDTRSSDFPTVSPHSGTNTAGTASPFLYRLVLAPRRPSAIEASLTALTVAEVRWTDNAGDETGQYLERKADAGAYAVLSPLPPDTVFYEDSTLERGKTYTYRVRAENDDGFSEYSGEAAVLSPPIPLLPPNAPSGLAVAVQPDGSIALTWQDNSLDEEQFQVNRSVTGGPFAIRASVISGTTSFTDTAVLPDRSYAYSVRAVNQIGVSSFTSPVPATTPPSLGLSLVKGLVSDSVKIAADRIKVTATVALNGLSPDGTFDPVADGLMMRLGPEGEPLVLLVSAADPTWVPKRKGKFLWKSPTDALTRAKVNYDPPTGTLKVLLKRLQFGTPQSNPVILWLGSANDAGHFEGDWFEKRPGLLKYPVPE